MRGYKQNAKNGNNVMLFNSELRLPVFATFIDKPINSAFLRNFQLTQFLDIGTAWNGTLKFKDANYTEYIGGDGVTVKIKEGFLGPFVGGYGFGARRRSSTRCRRASFGSARSGRSSSTRSPSRRSEVASTRWPNTA